MAKRELFKVLIIEDSAEDQNVLRTYLCEHQDCDYEFTCRDSGQDGIEEFRKREYDAVLLDYQLPDMDGIKILETFAENGSGDLPIVMITGQGDEALAVRALKRGAADYIVKSNLTPQGLYRATHNAIEKHRLFREKQRLKVERDRAKARELEALKEIKREKERLSEFFEQFPSPVALLQSLGLIFEFMNQPMRDLIANRGKNDRLFSLADAFGDDLARIAKLVYTSGKRYCFNEFEVELQRDGRAETIYLNITFEPHKRADGTAEGVIMAMSDVTDIVRSRHLVQESEHHARLSEDRFRQIAEILPHMIWVTDAKGNTEYLNRAWLEFTGTTLEDNREFGWMTAIHPDDRPFVKERWNEAVKNRSPYEITYRMLRKADHQHRWFIARGMPVINDDGEIEKWYGANADIHDQRALTENLRRSEQRLFVATQASRVGIWETDLEGVGFWRNEEYDKALGLTKGKEYRNIIDSFECVLPEDRAPLEKLVVQSLATQRGFEFEFRVIHYERSLHWVQIRGGLDRSDSGKIRLSGTVLDITDRKTREQDLQDARNVAVAANRTKTTFLANMSHEIRTPLNAIIGFTDLIASDEVGREERSRYAETVQRNGRALMQIIDDILDLSKIEAGKLTLEFERTDLRALVNDLALLFNPIAERKGLDFNIAITADAPEALRTDPIRLRQILMNAVSNAIKFTSRGSVTLKISQSDGGESGPAWLVVSVTDTGIGIGEEQQARLFKPFTQADASMTRKYGGTGLGLMLSRRLAKLLGGAFYLASSRANEGSTFELRLPITHAEVTTTEQKAITQKAPKTNRLNDIRILVVDDSEDSRMLSRLYLSKQGAKVDDVSSAVDAIEAIKQVEYDVLISDIQMPEKDGHALARHLRENGFKKPIIGLSAHVFTEDKLRSLESGMNRHIGKPVKPDELISAIISVLPRN